MWWCWAQPQPGLYMPSWGLCMLLQHQRGRSKDHPPKQPSAAKLVLICPSCQVLLPGYVPFLHPFHTADLTWEAHSLRAHLGGTSMGETGREAGWEGVAWAGQDAAPFTLSSPPKLCMLSMTSYGMECPFGQLGSAVPAVSPPNFLCTPSLLAGGSKIEKRACIIWWSWGWQGLEVVAFLRNIPTCFLFRGGMVQTSEQYEFVHHALSLYESRLSAKAVQ
ncbi:hypothetical protein QYF61_024383 [Mycteria americana]|uniref:Uncharacterized protein n=1 Tax=Mycteria americana TaxID=33587 RepID=A0AAN7SAD7_MYCAM|nr:hypothetical protein QYF61_024383 [Mycteria americana]